MGLNKCIRILLVGVLAHLPENCALTELAPCGQLQGCLCSQNVELPPLAILPQRETLDFHWQ